MVEIKPKTIKWEVSNLSPGRTFNTVRCIKDRLGNFLSEDIDRRSMISSRTSTAFEYTRTDGDKRVLAKAVRNNCTLLIITPVWPF